MIHVRADQVKNIKNAVADNFSGCRYPESHLLQCDLYRTEKMGLYFFRFWLAAGIVGIAGSVLIRLYGMPCVVEALIGIAVCLLLIAEIKIITGMCRSLWKKDRKKIHDPAQDGSLCWERR